MTSPATRIIVLCFASPIILLNKPLGRMTATWQKAIGPGTGANETTNRILYVIGGALFLILGILGN